MLPTLLKGGANHKQQEGGVIEGAIRPPAGKTEMAGLRAFLRSRCGSLKAAFNALDVHSVGQITSDDFVKGLQRLGYSEDAMAIFHAIDTSASGLVSLRTFLLGIGVQEEEIPGFLLQSSLNSLSELPCRPAPRASSEDAWRSARIPRHISDGHLARKLPSSPKHRRASTGDLEGMPPAGSPKSSRAGERPPAPPAVPPAAASAELQARLAWLEEQVSAEQGQRAELESRLAQHLDALIGISISEQLDVLRQQLLEERAQRQVDVTSLRVGMESIRSAAQGTEEGAERGPAPSEGAEGGAALSARLEDVAAELGARVGALEATSAAAARQPEEAAGVAKLSTRLEEVAAELTARMEALEVPTGVTRPCVSVSDAGDEAATSGAAALQQDVCKLKQQTASLEEQLGSLEHRFAGAEGAGANERERTMALVDERLAVQREVLFQEQSGALGMAKQAAECTVELTQQCSKMEARLQELGGSAPLCSLQQLESHVREKLDGLRQEWGAVIEGSGCRPAEAPTPSEGASSVLPEVLSHVRGYVAERLDGAQSQWKALLEEEHEKGFERARVLSRALGEEFERSITCQAVAEACAEARSAVSAMLDAWCKEGAGDPAQPAGPGKDLLQAAESHDIPKALKSLQGEVSGLFALMKVEEERRADVQGIVALLKGDVDNMRTRLQERAPARLEEVANRVTSLEAAFQHVGAAAQSDAEATTARRAEQLFSERLVAIDSGIARVSGEVKQQGEGLQQVQRRQQVLSDDFLGRMQAVIEKLDMKGLEGLCVPPSSPGAGAAKRGGGWPRGRAQTARSSSLTASYRSMPETAAVEVLVARGTVSRDRSPCLCPEDDSVRRVPSSRGSAAGCVPAGSTAAPTPATPLPPSVPVGSPAATYRSTMASPPPAARQAGAASPPLRSRPPQGPQGSPTLRTRPATVLPPQPVVAAQRMASVPQVRGPGGGVASRMPATLGSRP